MENKNTEKKLESGDVALDREGLLPLWLGLAGSIAERTVATSFGLVADTIAEARTVIAATLDYADALTKSGSRYGRKVGERVLDLGGDAVQRGERALQALVRAIRSTSAEAVGTATQVLVTPRSTRATA